MGDSRLRPGSSGARPPAVATDEALIELVQSLPLNSAQRAEAYETLVRRYEFVVKACVRRYRDSPESMEDLMQVGYLGLLKAIRNYDPQLGPGLVAYAQPCVSGELKRHFRDKRWQVRVQRTSQENMLAVRDARGRLTQQLGRSPGDSELAEAAGLTMDELRAAEQAEMAFRPYYLDAPVSTEEESVTFGELLGGDDPGIEHALNADALWVHWSALPQRQQRILALRFYGNLTQAEIGERLGISQMHVSRLLDAALTRLRDCLTGGTARPRTPRPRRRSHRGGTGLAGVPLGSGRDHTARERQFQPGGGPHATGIEPQARTAVRAHQAERQGTG